MTSKLTKFWVNYRPISQPDTKKQTNSPHRQRLEQKLSSFDFRITKKITI